MSAVLKDAGVQLAQNWQRDFPLTKHPFAVIAEHNAMDEATVIDLLAGLQTKGLMSRIGAAVKPNTIGASTLVALSAPPERFEAVANIVSAHELVNHNYEREHDLNLWFVVTARNRQQLTIALDNIACETQCQLHDLRLLQAFHIDLGFRLDGTPQIRGKKSQNLQIPTTDNDLDVICALADGLEFSPEPYAALGEKVGLTGAQVIDSLQRLSDNGVISRLGCILRHRALGFRANAMVVWDVPDDEVSVYGAKLANQPGVTLCYQRNRHQPAWRYNLFAMFHGQVRQTVRQQIDDAANNTGLHQFDVDILFSRRCFKQCGARYGTARKEAAA